LITIPIRRELLEDRRANCASSEAIGGMWNTAKKQRWSLPSTRHDQA
jgi:hypothetical protein